MIRRISRGAVANTANAGTYAKHDIGGIGEQRQRTQL